MKKLLNFGKILSRDQMKNITGGTTCTWTDASGNQSISSCGNDADTCQDAADRICSGSNLCSDVDCE